MKVSDIPVKNDLAKLLADVHVSGTGSNAKKALENLDGVSITYSDSKKRVPVLKDLKSGISIELSEKLELTSLTQLAKEFGFGGTAYQAGNLLNKNFQAVSSSSVKTRTSKDVFKECFDARAMMIECKETLASIVDEFIPVSLSDTDRAKLDFKVSVVRLAFMSAEERYEILKKNELISVSYYFEHDDYEEYIKLLKQESRFDSLPKEVQVMNEREDGYVLVKSDYMSVEDFISLQVKLKDVAAEDTLQISKTIAWSDDGITVDSVAITATLKLK